MEKNFILKIGPREKLIKNCTAKKTNSKWFKREKFKPK
jgi:hypothetical protein